MRVAIVVRSGPATGRRIQLKASQLARFGRSNWADFAFAEDSTMADIHFQIHCDSQACYLTGLAKDQPTFVNGQAVANVRLNSADIITAGQTQLALDIHGGSETPLTPADSAEPVAPKVDPQATARFVAYIKLSEPALELAQAHTDPETFEKLLIERAQWSDAIRWRAHRLPKPMAVAWALACLQLAQADDNSFDVDEAACQAAAAWSKDPSEENRSLAAQQLEVNGGKGVSGAIVAAAAWSGGSLAPPDLDVVPPDDRMTGHFTATALNMLSHLMTKPGSVTDRLKKFLNTPAGA